MSWVKQSRARTLRLNERDIIRSNYTIGGGVPTTVSFGMWLITDKSTTIRAWSNFGGVHFKENISCATNFMKMGEIWFAAKPKFIRGLVINRGRRSQCRKIGSHRDKFVPERRGSTTCYRHRLGFIH